MSTSRLCPKSRGGLGLSGDIVRSASGDVAQLAEHLLCKQGVVGSIPIVSTTQALGSSAAGGFLVPGRRWRDAKSLSGSDPLEVPVAFPIGDGAVIGITFGPVEVAVVIDDFVTKQTSRGIARSEHGHCLAQRSRDALHVV